MTLIVGNSAEGYVTNNEVMTEDLDPSASQVVIGYGLWLPRHFVGDLDEIRFGYVIPEPGILWIVGLLDCCQTRARRMPGSNVERVTNFIFIPDALWGRDLRYRYDIYYLLSKKI